jgi:glycosyltransferase involved in cell wall biosynthesis
MSEGALRVLFLNYEFPPIGGGGATSTFNLTRHLVRLGHRVDVVTMSYRGCRPYEQIDGVSVYRVPCVRLRREVCDTFEMATYVLSGLVAASRLARRRSYDVNNTHFVYPTGPVGYGVRRLTGLPYVLSARGSDVPGHNPNRFRLDHQLLLPFWRHLVRDADALTAVSNDLKREMLRWEPKIDVTVIPNGVSPLGEQALTEKVTTPWAQRVRRILVVTRLHEFKGVQYLLRAVADSRLDYEIEVVGDGPYRSTLEQFATAMPGRVRFHGWLDRRQAQLRDLYRSCGVFVFPSDREGAPAALLEAMSEGMAVIASNSAGAPEVVGEAGLLVEARDPSAIGKALAALQADSTWAEQLGQQARERVLRLFDWSVLAERYVSVYRLAAQGQPGRLPLPGGVS